jgi:hypothetical protein
MFLSAVLFVVFSAGCWLYCLTDAAITPAAEFPGLRKPVWISVIALTFILGAIAWVVARKSWRDRYRPPAPATHPARPGHDAWNVRVYPYHPPYPHARATDSFLAADALARHPASQSGNVPERAVPIGPDDDPEFIRMLAKRIRGEQ